jgi:hypothetical protein
MKLKAEDKFDVRVKVEIYTLDRDGDDNITIFDEEHVWHNKLDLLNTLRLACKTIEENLDD